MTEYPTGVYQNLATENFPVEPTEIAPSNWKKFSNQADADKGLGMIETVSDNATMVDAETLGAEGTQYIYTKVANALMIHCRVVQATAQDEDGGLIICEYPSDILDRDTTPLGLVDKYGPGQPHILKVQRLTSPAVGPGRGQLYWDVA